MLFVFCLAALLWIGGCGSVFLRSVPVGESLTLYCSSQNSYGTLRWIRLSIDKSVEYLATSDSRESSDVVKKDESGKFDLPLHGVLLNETGFYICCEVWYTDLKILNVTFLHVEEVSPHVTDIEEDSSEVHSGLSYKHQCSVSSSSKTSSCSERVYWFKPRADKSPSLLVAHEHEGEECGWNSTTGLKKCVYSVSRDVDWSHDETLYCAVLSCGQIFFGNGLKKPPKGKRITWLLI
ncbi:uncharacterized protein LOC128767552 [Synchiropus splendidus]|uniref:uncharacterized protein LOC128767552 n=1 Tax=Synchiropus splendidus TaxID=270530 RepID=UPI00237DAB02|nr:uncharacterized protein LOC128767552 [Synchiropus splendidus]